MDVVRKKEKDTVAGIGLLVRGNTEPSGNKKRIRER